MMVAFPDGVPKGMTFRDDGVRLEFSWRWYFPAILSFAAMALVWNGAVVAFVVAGTPLFPLLLHLAAGAGLGLFAVRKVINRTYVSVAPDRLTIETRPLGFGMDKVSMNPHDIKQLYIKRNVAMRINERPVYNYEVHAIVAGSHRDIKLAANVPELAQAHFIESRIEQYLEITNRPVPNSIDQSATSVNPDWDGPIISPHEVQD